MVERLRGIRQSSQLLHPQLEGIINSEAGAIDDEQEQSGFTATEEGAGINGGAPFRMLLATKR